jgi:hypothetical protein
MNPPPPPVANCVHQFEFLRSEEINVSADRNPVWRIQDVYFCRSCLTYKRVDVREEVGSRESFGVRVVTHRF